MKLFILHNYAKMLSANQIVITIINNISEFIDEQFKSHNMKDYSLDSFTKTIRTDLLVKLPELIDHSIDNFNPNLNSEPFNQSANPIINNILYDIALHVTKNRNYSIPKTKLLDIVNTHLSKKLTDIIDSIIKNSINKISSSDLVLSDDDDDIVLSD